MDTLARLWAPLGTEGHLCHQPVGWMLLNGSKMDFLFQQKVTKQGKLLHTLKYKPTLTIKIAKNSHLIPPDEGQRAKILYSTDFLILLF